MSKIGIPENATGHVGMVAALKRVHECDLGKLVVLREPAGFMTILVGSEKPVFGWLALSLGEPIVCNGKPSRSIYVADRCLIPMSDMPDSEVKTIAHSQAEKDFDAALDDLAQIVETQQLTPEDLDRAINKSVPQFEIQRALEIVAVPVALQEIGFTPSSETGEVFQWAGIHNGMELRFHAGQEWFDRWVLLATGTSTRKWVCDERRLPNEAPRGKIVQTVLDIWRSAFGKSSIPDSLELGDVYTQHMADMRRTNPGAPALSVDAQVFRATLKWLAERHLTTPDSAHELSLAFENGLLWLRIDEATYTCPAHGQWIGDYIVPVVELANLPPKARRGAIRIEQGLDYIVVNGHQMGARQVDSDATNVYETSPAAEPTHSATEPAPTKSVEVREIEYYDDTWDSSNYLTCFNRYYIFTIRPKDSEPKWEFLQPDSERWDAVHQRVYRNFRADRINRDQLPANLPPAPESIAPELLIPPPPPPPETFLRTNYAKLDERLQKHDGAMPVFLVLVEDMYESRNGDGKFHYPEKIVFSEEEAYSLKASSDDTYSYHVRAGLVWLDGETIGCEVPCRTFDHFSYADVLRMADEKLATQANG